MKNNKEMDILLSSQEIKVGDKLVVVKRFSFLDTIRLTAKLSALVGLILNGSEATATALNKIMYNPTEETDEGTVNSIRFMGMVELIGLCGEEGVDLMSDLIVKGTNMSYTEVEELDGLAGIDIMFALYEVNKGFFTKFMTKLQKKMQKPKKEKTQEK